MKKGMTAIISGLLGVAAGAAGVYKLMGYGKKVSKESKFRTYYQMLNQWMHLKHQGIKLEKYFEENNIKKIAIYGMGELGSRLTEELEGSNIVIQFGIDKMGGYSLEEFEVFSLEDGIDYADGIDAIVVTAVFDYDAIKKDLSKQYKTNIISLEDIIFGIN